MKIYVVLPGYDWEGMGHPIAAFTSKDAADALAKIGNDYAKTKPRYDPNNPLAHGVWREGHPIQGAIYADVFEIWEGELT